jgi:hypothetical protein
VLDWANNWISGLLSIPLRRAPQAVFIHGVQLSAVRCLDIMIMNQYVTHDANL